MRHCRLSRLKPLQVGANPRSSDMRHGVARILVRRGGNGAHLHGHFGAGFDLVRVVVPLLVRAVETFVIAQSVGPSFLRWHFAFHLDNILKDVGKSGKDEAAAVPSKEGRGGFVVCPFLFGRGLVGIAVIVVRFVTLAALALLAIGTARAVLIRNFDLAPPHPSPVVRQCQRFAFSDHLGGLGVEFAAFGDLLNSYQMPGSLAGDALSDLRHGGIDDGNAIVGVR
mmetsp:Transcript_41261/g.86611  ORF Transcript_41261/g.86611 Transcript_41261/m.86611 type:complete len:225 (+) Transcript_41261:1426-2100(+)